MFNKLDKKTLITITAVVSAFVLIFAVVAVVLGIVLNRDNEEPAAPAEENEASMVAEMNGVWIASISNIDFPSKPDLTEDELKAELDSIVETAESVGLNTIFFQVRPSADALYDSDIFPVSRYLSSEGKLTLDPLEYIIEAAMKKNISVHAWINPLRVAVGGTADDLPDGHPAKEHPEWCVKYADGKIYFDCGIPEVRQLVADGIKEIIEGYDVGGIVFDDYFYPYPQYETDSEGNKTVAAFEDSTTFNRFGTEYDDIGDWRRENVNSLVRLAYNTVKETDKECCFGVSPFGIWKNGYGDDSGSATRGSQSYYDIYCDSIAWVKDGYVDYIAPQLYWRAEESAASYTALCDWWAMMVEDTDVALFISHGAYRYDGWESPEGVMTSQVEYASSFDSYKGSFFYGYEEIKANTMGIADELISLYCTEENAE